jgi:hypothetical protein
MKYIYELINIGKGTYGSNELQITAENLLLIEKDKCDFYCDGVIERESNTVLFDKNYIIGNDAARSGNIIFDFTKAKLGAETEMRHNDANMYTFPAEAMLMFDIADISTTNDNFFLFVLTNKTIGSEVVKVFHAIEGGV